MAGPNRYGSSLIKAQCTLEVSGAGGSLHINDTAAHLGPFVNFQALEATVGNFVGNINGTTTAVKVPAGATLRGTFVAITLASGSGQAFYP